VAPSYNSADVGYLGYIIDSSVHNAYLLAWAETGLFGLLFYISFLAAPLVMAWKHIMSGSRFDSLMALGLGCALIAMSIEMLTDPFIARSLFMFVWLLVSLVACFKNFESIYDQHPTVRQALRM
jgi:O-antigen ligase